jgi:SnoaL-like domain
MMLSKQAAQAQHDREEIGALLAAYYRCVDTGRRAEVVRLFTEDGEFHGIDGTFIGPAQLAGFFGTGGTEADVRQIRSGLHVASPPCVTVDGDQASAWSTVIYVVVSGGDRRIAFSGLYEDDFRRVDGRWLIAVRRVVPQGTVP